LNVSIKHRNYATDTGILPVLIRYLVLTKIWGEKN